MPNDQGLSDFRSDTVTKPTQAMREAMASAVVGDDVFGDDPTVNALQDSAAALFGKEAGLFVPSGTMGNLLAIKVHTRPGDEILLERRSHMYNSEGGGSAWIAGVQAQVLDGPGGQMDPDEVRRAIRPDDAHFPRTSMLAVENTHNFHGGRVVPVAHVRALAEVAREHGLAFHMDGARVMNACVAAGVEPRAYGELVDTVQICLSKGLGAPSGSLFLGSAEHVRLAHRYRKALGGGMRQVGVLAAAGRLALEEGPRQLATDHANARALAEGFAAIDGLHVDLHACETNILFVRLRGDGDHAALVEALAARQVIAIAIGELGIRFVTHHHIDGSDVERAIAAMAELVSQRASD